MKLIDDILLKPHKVPKDMYQFKKMLSDLGMKYEKTCVTRQLYDFLERACQREEVLNMW
jgi:hypothetical protein